jgi:hypothetical protein
MDPKMSHLYRESFNKIKVDKEIDEILADGLHEKYDYLKDGDYKEMMEENNEFDPTLHDKDFEDELYTTDMSDYESDMIYKRYK